MAAKGIIKNWKVVLLLLMLLASLFLIATKGLNFGIDFKGGTQFIIHLSEKVSDTKRMERIRSVVAQRLDAYGLRGAVVNAVGDEFLIAQIAETDPKRIEELETVIKKQGKFEVTLQGKIVFTGEDIIDVPRDPTRGYGVRKEANYYVWVLPFSLKTTALKKFTEAAFHKCVPVSFQNGKYRYECEKTFFFLDRPANSIILIDKQTLAKDQELLRLGNPMLSIPQNLTVDELMMNADLNYIVVDTNADFNNILSLIKANHYKQAIIDASINNQTKGRLEKILQNNGIPFKEISTKENEPFLWIATGAKQAVFLTESVANMDKATVAEAEMPQGLIIRGTALTAEEAKKELEQLAALLDSGSLPVPVDNISRESISPLLGKSFLFYAALTGLLALFVVGIILFIRYRIPLLVLLIMFTGLSEVIIILGFASAINWSLDLAAIAGILAAVGTGVDDQIVITDELKKRKETFAGSLMARISRAFFIIFAAAATTIATMSPIIFFGLGLGKLVGFALTTIAGVLIGVFITRPAFAEIVKHFINV